LTPIADASWVPLPWRLPPGRFGAIASERVPSSSSFGALKQIDDGVLNVGYAELGSAGGPAVVLLHGWPYDTHSYVDVAPLLASAGYRVIVPYLRGYGTTRFLSSETFRNGHRRNGASTMRRSIERLSPSTTPIAFEMTRHDHLIRSATSPGESPVRVIDLYNRSDRRTPQQLASPGYGESLRSASRLLST
jgi:alpha/beta hydrolase fold